MSSRISQQHLESYLWGAAVLLRGTIDAGDYKQFIMPLLFYKRLCDVYDEETQTALVESGGDVDFAAFPENHRFQVPAEAHWREVRKAPRDVGQVLQAGMRTIETANPDKLYGIFGDAQWTNKDRLSDAMLRDLIEHFSSLELTIANLPEDELGNGYEYLIKKFADDSGHTAAEFYTNRTVVHLMTELLEPQPGETIYDPTCGSGGMLLSTIAHLRRRGLEWRNVRLYGQERNLMTSSIARMNCFLHGIEDFHIVRGDTLSEPKFVEGDRLQRFDVVLANPPYSIKQWDRSAFAADPWGRNIFGTPPQGRADYAFWQHILASMDEETGRCAILFPHGVLFRQEEAEMRRKLIEADLIECVLGLGPNLFYNSAMEACVVICRTKKPKERQGKILFINAVNEVTRERTQSFLTDEHIERIFTTYKKFENIPGFSYVLTQEDAFKNGGNLNIPLYVKLETEINPTSGSGSEDDLAQVFRSWVDGAESLEKALSKVVPGLDTDQALKNTSVSNLHVPPWFNRSKWRRVKLGDVAIRVAGKYERDETTVHRWVAADHVDEEDIHVRRWSDTNDPLFPPTFRFTFPAGCVLLHSRNPKKVAIPDFDGITGEKFFVLKSRDEKVLQTDFLAFVLKSSHFTEWVKGRLSGSVNKFLNWSSFERFEFDLPPLDQQRCIARILWAVDEIIEIWEQNIVAVRDFQTAFWTEHISQPDVKIVPISRVADVANGSTPSKAEDKFWQGGTIPWLPTGKVHDRFIRSADDFITEAALKAKKARIFPKGSVLVAMIGQGKTRGTTALLEIDAAINQNFACITPREVDNQYLFYALDFSYERLRRSAHGSNQGALNCGLVANFPIPIPSPAKQKIVAAKLHECENLRVHLKSHTTQMHHLLAELIRCWFP
ncbi:N-6 DNA methylase [Methanoculleus sp. UBA303]|uniref:N-6 DNA methylase n=1 Tax=Methanoculleus sp. UBA303 TaxID=1915497 RepID=UPI0025CC109D|nr:N-6 DNA methylase [Methanoculleus sp. UBA303]